MEDSEEFSDEEERGASGRSSRGLGQIEEDEEEEDWAEGEEL